jgi:choline kinase
LLAAGTGSRLGSLTDDLPKCLTEVNGTPILQQLVHSLEVHNFKRLVVVVGHQEQCIREHLSAIAGEMTIEYITSPVYKTTNNIYSLWLARDVIKEPFLLIESDLIFKPSLLEDMLTPDKIAVSHIKPWMNGTTITTDSYTSHRVSAFNMGLNLESNERNFKTVNMYSFSQQTWRQITTRLDSYISAGKVKAYYESVFAEMVADGSLDLECVFFEKDSWYEIDTLEDLHECELLFQSSGSDGALLSL